MNPASRHEFFRRLAALDPHPETELKYSSPFELLVAKSSYATDLRGQLLRLDGADRYDNKPLKFNGHNSKVVSIPLGPILEGEPVNPDEPPIC